MKQPPHKQTTKREYIYSMAELKEMLGIEGDTVESVELWRGLSPNDVTAGKSHDLCTYRIVTTQTDGAGDD